ncbi:hypothetical protein D3C81_1381980 [compost metagenome]
MKFPKIETQPHHRQALTVLPSNSSCFVLASASFGENHSFAAHIRTHRGEQSDAR